jgi:hypothetical protein
VRVRLRNTSPRPRVFNAGHRQIYVATGGRRLYVVPAQGPITLAPGQGVTSTLQFAWQGPLGSRRVDIALVPWSEVGRQHPRRLGIIRLQLAARR